MRSSEISHGAKAVAVGAALLWGIWTLVPVAMACVLVFFAALHFGIQALNVPTLAIGAGASMLVLALGIAVALRPAPRAELLRGIWLFAKIGALLLFAVGLLMLIVSNVPAFEVGDTSQSARLDTALRETASGLAMGAGWMILVVIPTGLAAMAVVHLWTEYIGQRR